MIPTRKRMSKKHIFLYFLSTFLVLAFVMWLPSPSKAVQLNGVLNRTERLAQSASTAAENRTKTEETQLTRLQTRANDMIAMRLDSLQKLQTRIQDDKQLTDADKTSLLDDVAATLSSLTALKTKIDADTDLTTAREDAKSIVTSYKIYVYFEPKIRLLTIIDNLQTATATISSLAGRVQTLLTTLQGQGRNVTAAQTALTDVTKQVAAINTILATDKTFLQNTSVTSSDPQSIFTQVRQNLATVRADIATIRADFATIRGNFEELLKTTREATSSAK